MEQPHNTYQDSLFKKIPNVWTLTLDRYQRDNLLQLLQHIMEGSDIPAKYYNSGDWVGELRWMLGKEIKDGREFPITFDIDENDKPNPIRDWSKYGE